MKKSTLFLILMVAAVSISLFVVKYRVQDLDVQLRTLNREYVETQETLHVLKAEWSHLNQPDRLRELADRYLEVGPPDAGRIGSVSNILEEIPLRMPPADAQPAAEAAQ